MIDRWIRAQRVGLAAYRLGLSVDPSRPKDPNAKLVKFSDVWNFLNSELEAGEQLYSPFQELFPPLVLKLLLSLSDGRLDSLSTRRPDWENYLTRQINKDEKGAMPKASAARVIAHHILHGTARPIAILRLGKAILAKRWRNYEENDDILETFQKSLQVLRSPWSETQKKVEAIESMSRALPGSQQWRYIENHLYHEIFAWPLLIFTDDEAISLPVSIDVYADGKRGVEIRGDVLIDTSQWEPHLWHAADAARLMWLGKHGNFGSERKEEVRDTSVVYDFSIANEIVTNFPEEIAPKDPSMEAYFCQVILSRLLGNAVSTSSVVTGSIGEQRTENYHKLADFQFCWPGGVPQKLKYVFQTRFFERVILPDLRDLPWRSPERRELTNFLETYKYEQSTEINYVKHLQHAADSFQIGGWRQFQYVRCPDIAWKVHPSGRRLLQAHPVESPGVQRCLSALRNNQEPLLDLSSVATPTELASALWHINVDLRERIPLRQRPPMLSWGFVRTVPEEQDTRFWYIVWKITGATQEDYGSFHSTADAQSAAAALADALNCFAPRLHSPSHRAPDLLILIGVKSLSDTLLKAKNPSLRCHSFSQVMEYLTLPGMLHPISNELMREHIGETRIITFDTDTVAEHGDSSDQESERESLSELGYRERHILNALTVFRFGFTQQMASLLWEGLGYDDVPVRDMLEEFVRLGAIRYGNGEYHIPGKIGQTLTPTGNSFEDAKKHYAAALSLAPYLSLTEKPGIAFDRAFQPHYVREADFHLQRSLNLLDRNHRNPFRQTVATALNRLLRFAEYPGWNTVSRLSKAGNSTKEAYEMAVELFEARQNRQVPHHPVHVLQMAMTTQQWWRELGTKKEHKSADYLQRLLVQIEDLYDLAEKACDQPLFAAERNCNLLKVLTQHSTFLIKNEARLDGTASPDRICQLIDRSLKLLEDKVDGSMAQGDWYELMGDRLQHHGEAVKFYQLGAHWVPIWHQLWAKLIGCSLEAHYDPSVAENICLGLGPEGLEDVLRNSLPGLYRDKRVAPKWVISRWRSFLTVVKALYGDQAKFMRYVRQYEQELDG